MQKMLWLREQKVSHLPFSKLGGNLLSPRRYHILRAVIRYCSDPNRHLDRTTCSSRVSASDATFSDHHLPHPSACWGRKPEIMRMPKSESVTYVSCFIEIERKQSIHKTLTHIIDAKPWLIIKPKLVDFPCMEWILNCLPIRLPTVDGVERTNILVVVVDRKDGYDFSLHAVFCTHCELAAAQTRLHEKIS